MLPPVYVKEKVFPTLLFSSLFPQAIFPILLRLGFLVCMILWFQMHISICFMKAINHLELHLISFSLGLAFWWGRGGDWNRKVKDFKFNLGSLESWEILSNTPFFFLFYFFVEMLFAYSNQHLWHWNLFAAGIKSPQEWGQIGLTIVPHRLASAWKLTFSSDSCLVFFLLGWQFHCLWYQENWSFQLSCFT